MFLDTWCASNLLLAALVIQLVRLEVYRELPFFVACITFRLIQALAITVAMERVQFLSSAYLLTWFVTEWIAMVLVALASVECYSWLTRRIFHLGRIGAVAVAIAACIGLAVTMGTSLDKADDLSRNLATQLQVKQSLLGFFAISLALLLSFYRRFPLYVPRQAWPHALTPLVYLATHLLSYAAAVFGGFSSVATMNEILPVTWTVCLVLWLWIFRKGVSWTPQDGTGSADKLQIADEAAKRLERLL